jgi:segregation and condensation protein A
VTAQHQSSELEPCKVSLDVFEGPLDLLLHLIRKHEIDIFDIPVSFITDRYLDYLAAMQELQLDIAAEYLEMAATLAHIKSQMLLPEEPSDAEPEEEGPDPREELVRRLLEYKKYKEAARDISQKFLLGRHTFLSGAESPEPETRIVTDITVFDLLDVVQGLIEKAREKGREGPQLIADRITVAERIMQIADVLRDREKVAFPELLSEAFTVFDVVITFLAILEMVKLHMASAVQGRGHGEIVIAQPRSYEPLPPPPPAEAGTDEPQAEPDVSPGEPGAPPGEPGAPPGEAPSLPAAPDAAGEEKGQDESMAGELNDMLGDFLKDR